MIIRRFVAVLLIILILCSSVFAKQKNELAPTLTFVYINGSNNNDAKMKNWYINGVTKLHPVMKKKFERNKYIKGWNQLNNHIINPEPHIFFWGYDSKTDLDYVKERLDITKAFSSIIAYEMRSLLTQFLHDAIWIQKEHNMLRVIDDLNTEIINLSKKGQSVVLYGYSAGTFVTYQYFLHKMPYIDLYKFFTTLKADNDFLEFVKNNPRQNTCLSALTHEDIGLGILSNTGKVVLYQNTNTLKSRYINIDRATQKYCSPPDSVKAVVNFASPIPLFYSDIADDKYDITFYSKNMIKYVFEHGIYFLTVNFKEDPLGFPTSKNLTIPQFEETLDIELENPSGVIYDNSKVWSKRPAFMAHTSYWRAKRTFSNAVVKSFVNGTKFLYDERYQTKVLNKRKKDPEILYEN